MRVRAHAGTCTPQAIRCAAVQPFAPSRHACGRHVRAAGHSSTASCGTSIWRHGCMRQSARTQARCERSRVHTCCLSAAAPAVAVPGMDAASPLASLSVKWRAAGLQGSHHSDDGLCPYGTVSKVNTPLKEGRCSQHCSRGATIASDVGDGHPRDGHAARESSGDATAAAIVRRHVQRSGRRLLLLLRRFVWPAGLDRPIARPKLACQL